MGFFFQFRILGVINQCKDFVLNNASETEVRKVVDDIIAVCTVNGNACPEVQAMKFVLLWKFVAVMESTGKFNMPTLPKLLVSAMSSFTSKPDNKNLFCLQQSRSGTLL